MTDLNADDGRTGRDFLPDPPRTRGSVRRLRESGALQDHKRGVSGDTPRVGAEAKTNHHPHIPTAAPFTLPFPDLGPTFTLPLVKKAFFTPSELGTVTQQLRSLLAGEQLPLREDGYGFPAFASHISVQKAVVAGFKRVPFFRDHCVLEDFPCSISMMSTGDQCHFHLDDAEWTDHFVSVSIPFIWDVKAERVLEGDYTNTGGRLLLSRHESGLIGGVGEKPTPLHAAHPSDHLPLLVGYNSMVAFPGRKVVHGVTGVNAGLVRFVIVCFISLQAPLRLDDLCGRYWHGLTASASTANVEVRQSSRQRPSKRPRPLEDLEDGDTFEKCPVCSKPLRPGSLRKHQGSAACKTVTL